MNRFTSGLDLGQVSDYSALAVLEQVAGAGEPLAYQVRHLQRWTLGTSYPAIVNDVLAMQSCQPLAPDARLLVDGTGVGRGIVDLFRQQPSDRRLVPVTIHGGAQTTRDGATGYWSVPKRELVGSVQVLLQSGRLKIAASLAEAATLTAELGNFRARISAAGHDSYGAEASADWREGAHDDLVLAVALACWGAEHARPTRWGAI